jgi:hypothetical protein
MEPAAQVCARRSSNRQEQSIERSTKNSTAHSLIFPSCQCVAAVKLDREGKSPSHPAPRGRDRSGLDPDAAHYLPKRTLAQAVRGKLAAENGRRVRIPKRQLGRLPLRRHPRDQFVDPRQKQFQDRGCIGFVVPDHEVDSGRYAPDRAAYN